MTQRSTAASLFLVLALAACASPTPGAALYATGGQCVRELCVAAPLAVGAAVAFRPNER